MDEEPLVNWHDWAAEQLVGVMSQDDPRYRLEVQLMALIAIDAMMMLEHERGILYPRVASEYQPHSWAWII